MGEPRPPVIGLVKEPAAEQAVDLGGGVGGRQSRHLRRDLDPEPDSQHAGCLQIALPDRTDSD